MPNSVSSCHLCHLHNHHGPDSLLRTSPMKDTRHKQKSRAHFSKHLHTSTYGHGDVHQISRTPSASALARLTDHSHSLPGSRTNSYNPYGHNVSIVPRGLETTTHFPSNVSTHSLDQTLGHARSSSLPRGLVSNHQIINTEPDILVNTMAPRSRANSFSGSSTRAPLGTSQDNSQDYYLHIHKQRYNDLKLKKSKCNMKTAILIGCYSILLVVAISVSVIVCYQNGWLGFTSPYEIRDGTQPKTSENIIDGQESIVNSIASPKVNSNHRIEHSQPRNPPQTHPTFVQNAGFFPSSNVVSSGQPKDIFSNNIHQPSPAHTHSAALPSPPSLPPPPPHIHSAAPPSPPHSQPPHTHSAVPASPPHSQPPPSSHIHSAAPASPPQSQPPRPSHTHSAALPSPPPPPPPPSHTRPVHTSSIGRPQAGPVDIPESMITHTATHHNNGRANHNSATFNRNHARDNHRSIAAEQTPQHRAPTNIASNSEYTVRLKENSPKIVKILSNLDIRQLPGINHQSVGNKGNNKASVFLRGQESVPQLVLATNTNHQVAPKPLLVKVRVTTPSPVINQQPSNLKIASSTPQNRHQNVPDERQSDTHKQSTNHQATQSESNREETRVPTEIKASSELILPSVKGSLTTQELIDLLAIRRMKDLLNSHGGSESLLNLLRTVQPSDHAQFDNVKSESIIDERSRSSKKGKKSPDTEKFTVANPNISVRSGSDTQKHHPFQVGTLLVPEPDLRDIQQPSDLGTILRPIKSKNGHIERIAKVDDSPGDKFNSLHSILMPGNSRNSGGESKIIKTADGSVDEASLNQFVDNLVQKMLAGKLDGVGHDATNKNQNANPPLLSEETLPTLTEINKMILSLNNEKAEERKIKKQATTQPTAKLKPPPMLSPHEVLQQNTNNQFIFTDSEQPLVLEQNWKNRPSDVSQLTLEQIANLGGGSVVPAIMNAQDIPNPTLSGATDQLAPPLTVRHKPHVQVGPPSQQIPINTRARGALSNMHLPKAVGTQQAPPTNTQPSTKFVPLPMSKLKEVLAGLGAPGPHASSAEVREFRRTRLNAVQQAMDNTAGQIGTSSFGNRRGKAILDIESRDSSQALETGLSQSKNDSRRLELPRPQDSVANTSDSHFGFPFHNREQILGTKGPDPTFSVHIKTGGSDSKPNEDSKRKSKSFNPQPFAETVEVRPGERRDSSSAQVIRAWTHMDSGGTFSRGQVRSDGSFAFTNCKPVEACGGQ